MRDRAYRRKQEARHYRKRLDRTIKQFRASRPSALNDRVKTYYDTGDSYETSRVYVNLKTDEADLWRLKWTKKLRRHGVSLDWGNPFWKKFTRRHLRRYLKMVPWSLPGGARYLKRASVIRPGYPPQDESQYYL